MSGASERAKLEKKFIDYMRLKHPLNDEFKEYITKCFQDDGYQHIDDSKLWPRDVRVLLMSFMKINDILQLAYTCKHWSVVLTSESYDSFWRELFKQKFGFRYCPVIPLPYMAKGVRTITPGQRISNPLTGKTKLVQAKKENVSVRISWKHCCLFIEGHSKYKTGRGTSTKLKTYIEKHYKFLISPKQYDSDVFIDDYIHDTQSYSESSKNQVCPIAYIDEHFVNIFRSIISNGKEEFMFRDFLIRNGIRGRRTSMLPKVAEMLSKGVVPLSLLSISLIRHLTINRFTHLCADIALAGLTHDGSLQYSSRMQIPSRVKKFAEIFTDESPLKELLKDHEERMWFNQNGYADFYVSYLYEIIRKTLRQNAIAAAGLPKKAEFIHLMWKHYHNYDTHFS